MPPDPTRNSAASVLAVPLHRQDAAGYCGAACIQMIREFFGEEIEQPGQAAIYDSSRELPGLAAECTASQGGKRTWHMCPQALAASLSGNAAGDYSVGVYPDRQTLLAAVESACRGDGVAAGKPSVVLVDNGGHWLVVHGVRRDAAGEYYLDVRDSWPPAPVAVHAGEDCLSRAGSATSYLLFPAGIRLRIFPNDTGTMWRGKFIAIVPAGLGEIEALPESVTSLEDKPDADEGQARAAAHTAFARAAEFGWPPALGGDVEVGKVYRVITEQWSGDFRWKALFTFIVSLHRKNDPGHVVALALVAAQGRSAGETRELVAPANGESWIPDSEQLRATAIQRLEILRSRDAEQKAAVAEQFRSLLPDWLSTADFDKQIVADYFWRSHESSRSPFHPFTKLSRDKHTAWLAADGSLLASLDSMLAKSVPDHQ